MSDTPEHRDRPDPRRRSESDEHEILEALNAEGVVDDPDRPEESEPPSTASDADAPPPPG